MSLCDDYENATDGVIGLDITNYKTMKFSMTGRTAQGGYKQINILIKDSNNSSIIKTISTGGTDFDTNTKQTISVNISEYSGFHFIVFHKVSSGWLPQIYPNISFYE